MRRCLAPMEAPEWNSKRGIYRVYKLKALRKMRATECFLVWLCDILMRQKGSDYKMIGQQDRCEKCDFYRLMISRAKHFVVTVFGYHP